MSTKTYCDACGKEGSINKFQYLCHITSMAEGTHMNGFVDNDMNQVSGRNDSIDLCNKCYNSVVLPSVKKFLAIQKENV